MKLLLFGATGGTGRKLVEQALELGHSVTAFARDPGKVKITHWNLRVVKGDILEPASVTAAVQGQDAVLSALGIKLPIGKLILLLVIGQVVSRGLSLPLPARIFFEIVVPVLFILLSSGKPVLSEGTTNIVKAMEHSGVKRYICESSLGVGDSRGQLGFLYSYIIIPLLLRNIFADKEIQEKVIEASTLDWVIVRPAVLSNGPRTGAYRVNPPAGGKISRADVAAFMLEQVASDDYVRKTPGISY